MAGAVMGTLGCPATAVVVTTTGPDDGAQCVPGPTPAATVRGVDWLNCTYRADEGLVTVQDGHDERPLADSSADEEMTYSFDAGPVSYGDVTGDGVEDALVPTVEGGTAEHGCDDTRVLTLWSVRDGALVVLGTLTQGGRGSDCWDEAAIQDGAVVVKRLVWSPDDPACCPGERRSEKWVWTGGELREDVSARQSEQCLPTGNCGWSS